MKKKDNISISLDAELKTEVQKIKRYSNWVAAIIAKALGKCPTCGGDWPKHGE
jgi:hypothetical protein